MKQCALCGIKTNNLLDGVCNKCKRKSDPIKIRSGIIKKCANCEKFFVKNKWTKTVDIEQTIRYIILSKIDPKANFKIKLPPHTINEGVKTKGELSLHIDDNDYLIPFYLEYTLCNSCCKLGTQYYEGILQIRNPTSKLLKYIENDVSKNSGKGVYITNKIKLKTGIDYFITSKSYLRNIGNKLKKQFKGELKMSAHTFARDHQKSKNIFRLNVLFRQKH